MFQSKVAQINQVETDQNNLFSKWLDGDSDLTQITPAGKQKLLDYVTALNRQIADLKSDINSDTSPSPTTDSQSKLQALKNATDEALKSALASEDFQKKACVNKANLNCVEAFCCTDTSGEITYQVLIEEASPDCAVTAEFVATFLATRGFNNVEIRLEW